MGRLVLRCRNKALERSGAYVLVGGGRSGVMGGRRVGRVGRREVWGGGLERSVGRMTWLVRGLLLLLAPLQGPELSGRAGVGVRLGESGWERAWEWRIRGRKSGPIRILGAERN